MYAYQVHEVCEHGWCVMVKNKDFLVRVDMCETSGIDLIDWIVYNDNDNNNNRYLVTAANIS